MDIEPSPFNDLLKLSSRVLAEFGAHSPQNEVINMVVNYWAEQGVVEPPLVDLENEDTLSLIMTALEYVCRHYNLPQDGTPDALPSPTQEEAA